MPKTNHTITNPAIGHRITFLQTAVQTNGELLQIEYVVERPEDKPAIPLHKHLKCTERFEAVHGKLGVILNDERRALDVGQSVTIMVCPTCCNWLSSRRWPTALKGIIIDADYISFYKRPFSEMARTTGMDWHGNTSCVADNRRFAVPV